MASKLPTARSGHSMLPFGQALILTGGLRCDASVYLLDLVRSDSEPVEFLALPTRGSGPGLRDAAAWCVFDNRLWCFGGISFGYDRFFDDLHVLDLESLDWQQVRAEGEAPPPTAMHSATLVGPLWVVVGGWRGGDAYSADVHVLDLRTLRWSRPRLRGPSLLPPLARHSAVRCGRDILLFGGWSSPAPGRRGRPLGSLYRLDTESWACWELRTTGPAPRPRDGHSAVLAGTRMLVFGGWDGLQALNDLHVLDLESLAWSGRVELRGMHPPPRYMHAAALVTEPIPEGGAEPGTTMYISGGFDGDARLGDLLALPLEPWVRALRFGEGGGGGAAPRPATPQQRQRRPASPPPPEGPLAAPQAAPPVAEPQWPWPSPGSPVRAVSPRPYLRRRPLSASTPAGPFRRPSPAPARRAPSPAPAPARRSASPGPRFRRPYENYLSWSASGLSINVPETDPRRAAVKQRKEDDEMEGADRARAHYEEELCRIADARRRRAAFVDWQRRPYYEKAEESALEARYRTSSLVGAAWPPPAPGPGAWPPAAASGASGAFGPPRGTSPYRSARAVPYGDYSPAWP